MGRASARLLALVAAGLLAGGVAACGGDDSESDGTTTAAPTATTQGHAQQDGGAAAGGTQHGGGSGGSRSGDGTTAGAKNGAAQPSPAAGDTSDSFTPPQHSDSGGGAGQFRTKGGDNSLQDHGSEASADELAQAAAALHGYLDARAAGAWRDACSYMVSGIAEGLAQFAGGARRQGCPELLAALSAGMPESVRRTITEADVGSLRVDGDSAFLLFRGADNTVYFMPMGNEDGEWKVGAIAASAIP